MWPWIDLSGGGIQWMVAGNTKFGEIHLEDETYKKLAQESKLVISLP